MILCFSSSHYLLLCFSSVNSLLLLNHSLLLCFSVMVEGPQFLYRQVSWPEIFVSTRFRVLEAVILVGAKPSEKIIPSVFRSPAHTHTPTHTRTHTQHVPFHSRTWGLEWIIQ